MMQSARQQAIGLILDYQDAIYKAVALLNAKSQQEPGFQMISSGYLDTQKRIQYAFHGIGCLITAPSFEVDFDFAHEGGCTGIDTWFMFAFLKSNPAIRARYPLLISEEQMEQNLFLLVEEGFLTKGLYSNYDSRYYLTANLYNSDLPTVTLYMPDEKNIS